MIDPELSDAGLADLLALQVGRGKKLPDWVDVDTLPGLLWRAGGEFPSLPMFLTALRGLDLETEEPLLAEVARRLEPASAGRLAMALLERWDRAGGPPAHKWVLASARYLADDAATRQLGGRARRWPAARKFRRAEQAASVLLAIGTDTALREIEALGASARSPAIKGTAARLLAIAAQQRGLSSEELGDRLVPTFGLDERGRRWLDFGARRFEIALEPDLSLTLRDDNGRARKSLPKVAKGDDPAMVAAAREWLQLAKKQIRAQATLLTNRLESAMVELRAWRREDWRRYLLEQPVARLIVRRLLWEHGPGDGSRWTPFRVAEDWTLADSADETIVVPTVSSVRICHPLNLDEGQREEWQELLDSYRVIAPFEQLRRECFRVSEFEARQPTHEAYLGYRVDGRVILAQLGRGGWRAGAPGLGGTVHVHLRRFPAQRVTAVFAHDEIWLGAYDEARLCALGPLLFLEGSWERIDDPEEVAHKCLPLGQVPPIALSEAVRDLERLARAGTLRGGD